MLVLFAALFVAFSVPLYSAVVFEDDASGPGIVVTVPQGQGPQLSGSPWPPIQPLLSQAVDKIYIFSLCSSKSLYAAASRRQVMNFLYGDTISQDRSFYPDTAYLIPHDGWQLYDGCLTSNLFFWDGKDSPVDVSIRNELGHRLIFSVVMTNDVHKYWCRIIGTGTNFGNALFNVATNDSGAENKFNENYVGISFGANRTCETTRDPSDGRWIVKQGGDDTVYCSNQYPSAVTYDVALRFGGSMYKTISTAISGMNNIKGEFEQNPQTLTAELVYIDGGVERVVSSYTIKSAVPKLVATRASQGIRLDVVGGQKMLTYKCQSATSLTSPNWTLFHPDSFASGRVWSEPSGEPKRFFRLFSGNIEAF